MERLHRTLLDEHFRIKVRANWYESVDQMQKDLDEYLVAYNTQRPHQGRDMKRRTPHKAFMDGIKDVKSKLEKVPSKKAA